MTCFWIWRLSERYCSTLTVTELVEEVAAQDVQRLNKITVTVGLY